MPAPLKLYLDGNRTAFVSPALGWSIKGDQPILFVPTCSSGQAVAIVVAHRLAISL